MSEKSQKSPILLAETNFLFDWAFERDINVQYLLELAEQNRIKIGVPQFAFAEAKGQSEVIIHRRFVSLVLGHTVPSALAFSPLARPPPTGETKSKISGPALRDLRLPI